MALVCALPAAAAVLLLRQLSVLLLDQPELSLNMNSL